MLAALSPQEILLIVGAVVILFGARKLPEIGKGLGQGIKEFKSATKKAAEEDPPAGTEAPKGDTPA